MMGIASEEQAGTNGSLPAPSPMPLFLQMTYQLLHNIKIDFQGNRKQLTDIFPKFSLKNHKPFCGCSKYP
jgi:hypothetical protein